MKKALIFDIYDDYNIRIQYIQSALERNGYQTTICFADFDHVKKEYYANKREDVHYIHVQSYKRNLSYARMHSHALFARACVKEAEKHNDVSLIYVMVPPNSMAKEFGKYKKKHPDVKVWFDVLDMWPESLPVSNSLKKLTSPFLNIWRDYRNDFLHDADIITPECNLFRNTLLSCVDASKMHTVYLSQPDCIIEKKCSISESIRFLYCGSINNIVDVDLIVTFLKNLSEKKDVHLDIIGEGEHRESFISELEKNHISYTYHGIVYDELCKKEIYQNTHFGLNIMKDTVFVGLTMKSLEYLSHGLPIINNIQGDTTDIVNESGIGLNLGRTDVMDTVEKIVKLTDSEYKEMCEKTETVFKQVFEEQVVNQQFDEVIKQLEE